MNNLRNKVQLIGNVGNTPEIKEIAGGKTMAKFSLATNESYRSQKGERVNETYWHYLTVWGKQAEIAEKFIQKGSEIAIEGKLHPRSYTDKDGTKKYVTDIIVNEIVLLGKKEK